MPTTPTRSKSSSNSIREQLAVIGVPQADKPAVDASVGRLQVRS
ncbi:hypothetical protein [Saccharopolyspora spinosa]